MHVGIEKNMLGSVEIKNPGIARSELECRRGQLVVSAPCFILSFISTQKYKGSSSWYHNNMIVRQGKIFLGEGQH